MANAIAAHMAKRAPNPCHEATAAPSALHSEAVRSAAGRDQRQQPPGRRHGSRQRRPEQGVRMIDGAAQQRRRRGDGGERLHRR
jgi:hypothetical protein